MSRNHWNDESLHGTYDWVIKDATERHGVPLNELDRTDLSDVANNEYAKLVYFRGKLQGIKDADEMKDVLVTV